MVGTTALDMSLFSDTLREFHHVLRRRLRRDPGIRNHSEAPEPQEQFAADPGIRGRIVDLSRRQLRRSPVGRLGALGNPDLQEHPGEISQASLSETAMPRNGAQVEHAHVLERMQKLERADIIRQPDPDLEGSGSCQQLRRNMKIGFLPQTEEIHSAGSGCLNQAGQVTVSRSETGPRLSIKTDELLLAKVLQRAFQILCGSDEAHIAPVSAYRKARHFLPGYCTHNFDWPGSCRGNGHRKPSLAQ